MKGYHGVEIDEIADACGVVRGIVLKHFGSKQSLYRAVLYGRRNPAGDYMETVCNDTGISVPETLKHLPEITMNQFKENLKYMRKDLEAEELL